MFYRAPPGAHPGARGERRYDPNETNGRVVHARPFRRREPQQRPWLLDTGRKGIQEAARLASAPPAEAAEGPPECARDGVRNSFHTSGLRRSPQLRKWQKYSHSVLK